MSDWLKKANRVLSDIAGEAGRQAESVQLQAKLGSLDTRLDEVYIEAGKRAEELVRERQVFDEEIKVILERARQLKEEMMEVRQQVQDLRHKPDPAPEEEAASAPPPQPTAAPEEAQPQAAAAPEEAVGEKACPTCGGEVTTHMVFCPHCGEKQVE